MKILFVNNKTINCGVYQYGKRVGKILSPRLSFFHYCEVVSLEEFLNLKDNYDIIVFNYIAAGRSNAPLGWLDQEILEELKGSGVKVGTVGHLNDVKFNFDFILSQYPSDQLRDDSRYYIFRPLPFDMVENPYIKNRRELDLIKRKVPRIGSFGFASKSKGFTGLIRIINSEFSKAEIRFHIASADYSDPTGEGTNNLISECKAIKTKSGISLNITSGFVDDESILDFLSGNDLNVFNYDDNEDGGVSSVIDFAISSGAPFAVSRSRMFRHVLENCLVIDKGLVNALREEEKFNDFFMKKWSHEAFTDRFLSIMEIIAN